MPSLKRKDSKGRLLREGESQLKDGRYMYRYTDINGRRNTVYSWKLVETDKIPSGKRLCVPLRDMEQQIRRDTEDKINGACAKHTTLNMLFDEYIETKDEIKESTRVNYRYAYTKYVRDTIGNKPVSSIRYSDIFNLYRDLVVSGKFKSVSLDVVNNVISPVLKKAVKDDLIRKNPAEDVLIEIKKKYPSPRKTRYALTKQQQDAFMEYVSSHKRCRKWLPLFTVLLGTGGRISEILGLRWEDCDFERGTISINHILTYKVSEKTGKIEYRITTPKTDNGVRIVPMLSAVRAALLEEKLRQKGERVNDVTIGGMSGFIFRCKFGGVLNLAVVNARLRLVRSLYNEEEKELAEKENREPNLLPSITAHILRHTFCTRLCEREHNLKIIKEIMGHAKISTTMEIYAEANEDIMIEEFDRIDRQCKII